MLVMKRDINQPDLKQITKRVQLGVYTWVFNKKIKAIQCAESQDANMKTLCLLKTLKNNPSRRFVLVAIPSVLCIRISTKLKSNTSNQCNVQESKMVAMLTWKNYIRAKTVLCLASDRQWPNFESCLEGCVILLFMQQKHQRHPASCWL